MKTCEELGDAYKPEEITFEAKVFGSTTHKPHNRVRYKRSDVLKRTIEGILDLSLKLRSLV